MAATSNPVVYDTVRGCSKLSDGDSTSVHTTVDERVGHPSTAEHHTPVDDQGYERIMYMVMAHTAIDEEGQVGKAVRAGRPGKTMACGALASVLDDLERGTVDMRLDYGDVEQSLLRQRLVSAIKWGEQPTLVDLTMLTLRLIGDDLLSMTNGMHAEQHDRKSHYITFTGILIEGPNHQRYVYPGLALFHPHEGNPVELNVADADGSPTTQGLKPRRRCSTDQDAG